MDSCHSGDHIAKDHIHTYITTCNIEEPQQKYRLGTVRDRKIGGSGGLILVFLDPNPPSPLVSVIVRKFNPHEGFLTHWVNQHRKQTNHE